MPIPFGLTMDQFAARYRGLLEKHSPTLIRELREVLSKPVGEGVTGAHIEIFLDAEGESGPSFGMYFDGANKKVDHSDQAIFPGRHLPIGECVRRLPLFDPRYYSDQEFGALNIQGDVCKVWFAEWWWKAGGWSYPLKVDIDVHDCYGDGNGILLAPGSQRARWHALRLCEGRGERERGKRFRRAGSCLPGFLHHSLAGGSLPYFYSMSDKGDS